MTETLQWTEPGKTFSDGSKLSDWIKTEDSGIWHWQYDTHEMTFSIYEHDGQYWKLYLARWVPEGASDYEYGYGGQACRMVLVSYRDKGRSPHSSRLMAAGDVEWIRTYEFDAKRHRLVKAGEENAKYGPAYGPKKSAA
ncbi:hypothetical protein HBA54_19405 [Pelagibius litoralis]|uniref:Uncharacterized protein n=1 Tax=Pelagibius litoralis TaxID=374515 RepID=A0A967KH03_9PROT|nr:hypothetical protein [Pelagibius litoralis]NIA70771.1 hypothetical protein [Pelagibius litoralis]